ncbi:glycosyltransferase [Leptospira sp. 'Mane']|uniref:glycosyltransferase n=1 Tax=Leptospira sp. 'Mane' TaxID=3387407 RepID=UPI00398A7E53
MKPFVHQFSAGFQVGDAISQEMLEIKRLLQINGYRGNIYSENVNKPDDKYAEKYLKAKISTNDWLIYHHSIHSGILPFLIKQPNPKILIYHNVTPHNFLEPYDLHFTYLLREGRHDLHTIKDHFQNYFAVSNFNNHELLELGFQNSKVMPLHLNFAKWNKNTIVVEKAKHPIQFLFVGRIAPNKRQDDLIRFAKIWKLKTNKEFRLKMVGFCNPNQQAYLDELHLMIKAYDLVKEVEIVPYVNESILTKYYLESSYFISMSEHEGFCVPLLEAMHFGLPVIAYDAGAVSETLNGNGILFAKKDFEALIQKIESIESDENLKSEIIGKQSQRLQEYVSKISIAPLLDVLEK